MSDKPELGDALDREFTLAELLRSVNAGRLLPALQELLGAPARLVDLRGTVLVGEGSHDASLPRVALQGELEPLGYLEAAADPARLAAAKQLIELLLRSNVRYLMASAMHSQVIDEDYRELQRKHEALKASEARYKALSENLEQRVQEQVKTIEQAQRQLYQSEKLASVGQLAAGVAHEINNPMGFVSSNLKSALSYLESLKGLAAVIKRGAAADELLRYWQDEELDYVLEDFADLLGESQSGADRVARIVSDLKDFTRIDHTATEVENINHIIAQVINVARPQIGGHIRIALEAGEIPDMRCNPGQLGQVFYNMLLNAAQSIERAGQIRFRTDLQGEAIRVRIEDNGAGIPAEFRERIFDPFFTTREVGQGTGLGLTVSNDIVKAHGGRIELESVPGKGTRFTIYLPLQRT